MTVKMPGNLSFVPDRDVSRQNEFPFKLAP
jgi:hypothetical protein